MVESAGVWMPLGLAYLAGSLRSAGFEPSIYDAMSLFHDADQIRDTLSEVQPDVVALTAYTATADAALQVLQAAKEAVPGVTTVIGGVHPTFMAAEILQDPAADYVVRGEGEEALPELLTCLNAGESADRVDGISFRDPNGAVVHTPDRALIADLDALPIAWDLIDWPTYYYRTKPGSRLAITSWSRGCTEACTFCSQQKLWRQTWRPRSVDAIIAEVRMLRSQYGVDTLEVADECPTRDRDRWERILDRLIHEDLGVELLLETRTDDIVRDEDIMYKYRAAGILHMYAGVESGRQDRLDLMRKNLSIETTRRAIKLLNDAGIISETSFLLGFPQDTPETVQEALDLSIEYSPDLAFFLAVTPWPYSDMYASVADRIEVREYSLYNLTNPIIRPDAMSREELSALLSKAFMTFYMHKMRSLHTLPPHKREYMMRVAKLLMEESYLSEEVKMTMAGMKSAHPGGMCPAKHNARA